MPLGISTAEAYERDIITIADYLHAMWNKGVVHVSHQRIRELAILEYRRFTPTAQLALGRQIPLAQNA